MRKPIQVFLFILSSIFFLVGIIVSLFNGGSIIIPIIMILMAILLNLIIIFLSKKLGFFNKVFRMICISCTMIGIIVGIISIWIGFRYDTIPIADYDKRVEIWGEVIPFNSPKNKLEDMNIDYNANFSDATNLFTKAISGSTYKDVEREIDTFTYVRSIKTGYEKETYEDVPFIIPYLVDKSDSAVIVVPGGGYGYKNFEVEGKDIALALNENGFNAFVLWYRSNPYERPVPQLDLQRAIRYIRYYNERYKIDKNKISIIGFSAGGNQVGSYINTIQGKDSLPENYIKDAVDLVDDKVSSGAMIYPALSYNDNVNMLFASYESKKVRDDSIREKLLEENDLILNFNSSEFSQFIAYGTEDEIVGMREAKRYIGKAKEFDTDIIEVLALNQGHVFKMEYYFKNYISWLTRIFSD